jgi:hypothetical protein
MSPRARRNRHASDASKTDAEKILEMMYMQGKAQFGDAMKSFWVYDGDFCPACLARPIDKMKFKGKDALSINGFMYRARGVMIGYFLCDTCANYIFNETEKHPYQQTSLHTGIEQNLRNAYDEFLSSLDA